jgi:splicing factor 3A subunit 1
MPDYPSKPAWGCDGTDFNLDVPLTLLVATLRDRIAVRAASSFFSLSLDFEFTDLFSLLSRSQAKRGLPISKQKLTYNGRVLVNSATLAGLNLQDGDKLHVTVKEKK